MGTLFMCKDRQLAGCKELMSGSLPHCDYTCAYLHCRSNDEELHVTGLRQEHQQMAKLLHKAEQQGILDVLLVRVTLHEECEVVKSRPGHPLNRQQNTEVKLSDWAIHDWRSLDGSQPGWVGGDLHRSMNDGQDYILQVAPSV